MESWPEPVERVAAYLRARGIDSRLEEFHEGAPTAAGAAEAIGCALEEIVKSLVFVCDGLPYLVLVPGHKRADPSKVAAAAGAAMRALRVPRRSSRRRASSRERSRRSRRRTSRGSSATASCCACRRSGQAQARRSTSLGSRPSTLCG
jgi:hypothetical protein